MTAKEDDLDLKVWKVSIHDPEYHTHFFQTVQAHSPHPGLTVITVDANSEFHLRTNLPQALLMDVLERLLTGLRKNELVKRKLN